MIDFSDLDDTNLDNYGQRTQSVSKGAPKTFPCMSCAGTGLFRGQTRFEDNKCFACNGRGFHNKPHFEAMADKKARKAKMAQTAVNKVNAIKDALPAGLFQFMAENRDWNDFFGSMVDQINGGRAMTDNQLAAVIRIRDKTIAKRAEKAQARTSDVDLSTIHAMFDKARESGLTKLVYRANGLVLTPAKASSVNAGGIYVKTKGGEYLGKVMGTKFLACREATDEHKATLAKVALDPAGEAVAYGRATGECCCCGRELTDATSIAAGIGPICADKWGF